MKNTFMNRIIRLFAIIIVLIFVSSTLLYLLERNHPGTMIHSFSDALWWGIVTVTTIGYGDIVPLTPGGRIIGTILIVFGFCSLTIFTAILASVFVEDKLKGAKGLKKIKLSGHFVICGLNDSTEFMLKAFQEKRGFNKNIVLVGNYSVEKFESIQSKFTKLNLQFVRGEQTQVEILNRASISSAERVFIVSDEQNSREMADDYTIVVVNTVKYINPDIKLTVQLINASKKHLLKRSGVDEILVYDELSGYILANNPESDCSVSIVEKLLKENDHRMELLDVPEHLVGKSFGDLHSFLWGELNVIAIGLIDYQKNLKLNDIFSDDSSAIDEYIKATLAKAKSVNTDRNDLITIHPDKDFKIKSNHKVLIL